MFQRRRNVVFQAFGAVASVAFCSNAFVVRQSSLHYGPFHLLAATTLSQQQPFLDTQSFEQCWKATTWSVNPNNDTFVNGILQQLCSPAPQSLFVLQRAIHLQQNSSSPKDTLSQCTFLLKPGHVFQVCSDDKWRIVKASDCGSSTHDGWSFVKQTNDNQNAVQLAHEALDLVTDASQRHCPIDIKEVNRCAHEANLRLEKTLGTDVRGRASADAAFLFSMAGITDEKLYKTLVLIARLELERTGKRPSFRGKYVLQIVEKLAAAGIKQEEQVYRVAAASLESKKQHLDVVDMLCRPRGFQLFSSRPLLWLWRFSSRQPKVAAGEFALSSENVMKSKHAASREEWVRAFDDLSRPLIVDLGCGMGISILGLASMDTECQEQFNASPEGMLLGQLNWRECNHVGGDLSQLCLGYARGIANRWGLDGKLQFTYGSALDVLKSIESQYRGRVAIIMIQFPTPFQVRKSGNQQLPSNPESGFMVTEQLLKSARRVLECSRGVLLLQSNCEDVAVTMRNMAMDAAGFEGVRVPSCVTSLTASEDPPSRIPQRTLDWIESGGERAIGDVWSRTPLLPSRGATETEVSCRLSDTPVHRCILQPRA